MASDPHNVQAVTWIVALLAAFIGGGLSAYGAWLAIGRQVKAQQATFEEVAREFFAFVIDEDIARLESLQSYRSANAGATGLFDLELLIANYQAFDRNREHLIRLDQTIRRQTNEAISRVQILAISLQRSENEKQSAKAKLSQLEERSPEHAAEKQKFDQSIAAIDQGFGFIPGILSELRSVRNALSRP